MIKFFLHNIIFLLLTAGNVWADVSEEMVVQANLPRKINPAKPDQPPNMSDVRRDLIDLISVQAAEQMTIQLLGAEKVSQSQSILQKKIYPQSQKIIAYLKTDEIVTTTEGFSLRAQVKISVDTLRDLLKSAGIYGENSSAPTILPMIVINDLNSGQSSFWWRNSPLDKPAQLLEYQKNFEESLQKSFFKSGFYSLSPWSARFQRSLNIGLSDRTQLGDLRSIVSNFGTTLVIPATINYKTDGNGTTADFKVQVLAVENGKVLAEVRRKFEIGQQFPGMIARKWSEWSDSVITDLVAQTLDGWQKGTLHQKVILLSWKSTWDIQFSEVMKAKIKNSVPNIRVIFERVMRPDLLQWEIESSLGQEELVAQLSKLSNGEQKFRASSVGSNEIELKGDRK